jgi:antitoxin HicB
MPARHGSRLDDFLEQDGVLDEFQVAAIKEVITCKIQQATAEKKLSKDKMARLMKTSRAQLDRLLDVNAKRADLSAAEIQ